MTHPPRIVIAGAARSGTTVLFRTIRGSLSEPVRELFEVRRYQPLPGDEHRVVLAKVLLGPPGYADYASFESFERQVGLIRDPRDWVISVALYSVYTDPRLMEDRSRRLVDLLKKKQQDPTSVDARAVVEAGTRGIVARWCRAHMDAVCGFFDAHPDYFQFRYEDFVRGAVGVLEEYLGFSLAGRIPMDARLRRVTRTKSAGDWRNWFTPEDVSFFRSLFSDFMRRFGYPDDWTLPVRQMIHPEHGSRFVERLISERRLRSSPRSSTTG